MFRRQETLVANVTYPDVIITDKKKERETGSGEKLNNWYMYHTLDFVRRIYSAAK